MNPSGAANVSTRQTVDWFGRQLQRVQYRLIKNLRDEKTAHLNALRDRALIVQLTSRIQREIARNPNAFPDDF